MEKIKSMSHVADKKVWLAIKCKDKLRLLDWIFHGHYLACLSINYVAINKDLEKYHRCCIRSGWKFVVIVFHLQWGCHSNKMMSLSILLAVVFLGTWRFFPKLFMRACSSSSCLNVCEVWGSDPLTFLPSKRYLAGILIKSNKFHSLLSVVLYSFQPTGCKVFFWLVVCWCWKQTSERLIYWNKPFLLWLHCAL